MRKSSDNIYSCSNCGYESLRWLGQCPNCNEWNTFEEIDNSINMNEVLGSEVEIYSLKDIKNKSVPSETSGFKELDRVLGGSLVNGSVILISGEPGIGKSTLLLQVLAKKKNSFYISAEESLQQIGLRAKRLGLDKNDKLQIVNSFEINSVIDSIKKYNPELVVIDSIQTIYSKDVRGLPGGVAQIKAVASKLIKFAKAHGVTMFIVGQVTKDGSVAGPKLLEHLVDVVLELEGDSKFDYRILRCFKNRFGPTNEIGVFEMTEKGMQEVESPSLYFLQSDDESRVGVCPGVLLDGNRLIIIELQSLSTTTFFPLPRRVAEGVSKTKLEVLTAIIAKYTKFNISNKDIYVNIAGGLRSQDSMLDLSIVLSIISSLTGKELEKNMVSFGEVTLTGQIRYTKKLKMINKECKRLGYTTFNEKYPNIKNIKQLFLLFNK